MDTPSWQRIFEIFEEAAELPPEDRSAFLDRACGGSEELRSGVENLLAAEGRSAEILDQPLAQRPWVSDVTQGAPQPSMPPLESLLPGRSAALPSTLGAYRLLRQIGQGGMSTVFLAVRDDDAFKRQVVVKVVRRGMETTSILRRLRTERQILASLDHPYVARLYDGGSTAEGLPYFVMEYVDGVPIDEYCEQNELDLGERLTLFRKVCAAVHYAHQNLVVHRDIKPSNILVTADGDPKLLDFGIAKLLNPDMAAATENEPTATWQRMLTPSYASPEQVRGKHITTASDVYSLGVLLYKLLTGRLPRSFKGRSQQEIEQLLADTDPLPPSLAVTREPAGDPAADGDPVGEGHWNPSLARRIGKQLSGDLDAIVLKALRSAPRRRYPSVERLEEDVERYQGGLPVTARAGTWRYRAGKFVRRNRTAVSVAGVAAVLLIAFAAAMAWQSARVARERDEARIERDSKQAILRLIFDVFELSNPYVAPRGQQLTVQQALELSVPVLEDRLADQPAVRAELLQTSGHILNVLGIYDSAERQLGEALALRRELHGDRHREVVEGLRALASARKNLGRLDEAEELAQEAVEIARRLDGEPPRLLASSLAELVSVRCFKSEFALAESPAREVLELARSSPDAVEEEIIGYQYLGYIHNSRGEYRESADHYREALTRLRARYGEQHPIQVNTLSNYGLALRRLEDFEGAEQAYEELLALQRESFPEDFVDPVTLGNLAGARYGRGDYEGSEELYGQAVDAALGMFGPKHPSIYIFELGRQQSRIRLAEAAEAETALRRLLARFGPELGESSWRIAQGESVLGESVSVQGRCAEAGELLVGSYLRLLESARRQRHKQDGFERLRDHFERCSEPEKIAEYEALLNENEAPAG